MLAAMSRTCPEALLLIDETFREATHGTPPAASFAGRSPRLLTCGSMSKAYGAPGLRIGWLTVPGPELCEQLRLARFNTALSCGSLDEFLAARLLRRADEVLAARGAVLAEARGIAERWVKGHRGRWAWLPPQAGAFCCVRLEPAAFGLEEIDRFHAYLAEQRVLVAPGPWFGDSAHVVRLGLAYEPTGPAGSGPGDHRRGAGGGRPLGQHADRLLQLESQLVKVVGDDRMRPRTEFRGVRHVPDSAIGRNDIENAVPPETSPQAQNFGLIGRAGRRSVSDRRAEGHREPPRA